jgi:uroporphyrinogen-III synthase
VIVVLTRERGSNDPQRAWLPDEVDVREVPLTSAKFLDPDAVAATLRASEDFGNFRALVVTSARSARYVELARPALADDALVLSVGSATAVALEGTVDVVGYGGSAELAPAISEGPVLLLGAADMRDDLADALKSKGIVFSKLTCYETVPEELTEDDKRLLREADVVFIGAPSAWSVAAEHVSEDAWVVVPGGTTAGVVQHSHARVVKGWGPHLRQHLLGL